VGSVALALSAENGRNSLATMWLLPFAAGNDNDGRSPTNKASFFFSLARD